MITILSGRPYPWTKTPTPFLAACAHFRDFVNFSFQLVRENANAAGGSGGHFVGPNPPGGLGQ
jgi:hypothetical protein